MSKLCKHGVPKENICMDRAVQTVIELLKELQKARG